MDTFAMTPLEIEALNLSLRVALWCVAISLPFGIACAWVLARMEFPGKTLFDSIIHLPLVLPPVVVGYALLVLFGRQGPLGDWLATNFGIDIAFTWKGAVVASAVMAFPLMVRAIRLSMEAVDPGLEAAARTLGAGRIGVLFSIPGETRTLPLALYGLTQVPGSENAAMRLVVISTIIAFTALIASEIVARRIRKRLAA
jgi:molybdate transport system permease protein